MNPARGHGVGPSTRGRVAGTHPTEGWSTGKTFRNKKEDILILKQCQHQLGDFELPCQAAQVNEAGVMPSSKAAMIRGALGLPF